MKRAHEAISNSAPSAVLVVDNDSDALVDTLTETYNKARAEKKKNQLSKEEYLVQEMVDFFSEKIVPLVHNNLVESAKFGIGCTEVVLSVEEVWRKNAARSHINSSSIFVFSVSPNLSPECNVPVKFPISNTDNVCDSWNSIKLLHKVIDAMADCLLAHFKEFDVRPIYFSKSMYVVGSIQIGLHGTISDNKTGE